jgi:RNA polymerase sigma factor (sigma-70 family)
MIDFTNLYDRNIDSLMAFGSRLTTDSELLKDCIQDVFVKFYVKRDDLSLSVKNIDNYLYISLRNRINDEYRRQAHLCDSEINDIHMRSLAENEDSNHEFQEHQQDLIVCVEEWVHRLSPRQQQLINLYYVKQMKYDDICQIMGIGYQSVRNLMHRSLCRLREYATQLQLSA